MAGSARKARATADSRLNWNAPRADPFFMTTALAPPVVIEPRTGWASLGLAELWQHRELVGFLALRDVRVRYKQSLLGATWALLQPIATLAVFGGMFGALLGPERLPSVPGAPYAVSTLCALAPWQLFARAVTAGGDSLVVNQALVTKTYLPRLAVPLAPVLASLVDFGFAFAVLALMLAWFGIAPGPEALLLPVLVLMTVAASLGAALWLAAVNALYRDVRLALPFAVQLAMLVTPVVYTAPSVLGDAPTWLAIGYGINPMAGIVEGFRFALLGGASPPWTLLAAAAVSTCALLASGLVVFRRLERVFADRV